MRKDPPTEKLLTALKRFALDTPAIQAVIVVGSYARGTWRADSDRDIVIITADKAKMVTNQSFTHRFGTVTRQQTEQYGACTSVRAWYSDGLEVEYGLVEPSWISQPLDPGTAQVLRGGYRVIVDKNHSFDHLDLSGSKTLSA